MTYGQFLARNSSNLIFVIQDPRVRILDLAHREGLESVVQTQMKFKFQNLSKEDSFLPFRTLQRTAHSKALQCIGPHDAYTGL